MNVCLGIDKASDKQFYIRINKSLYSNNMRFSVRIWLIWITLDL